MGSRLFPIFVSLLLFSSGCAALKDLTIVDTEPSYVKVPAKMIDDSMPPDAEVVIVANKQNHNTDARTYYPDGTPKAVITVNRSEVIRDSAAAVNEVNDLHYRSLVRLMEEVITQGLRAGGGYIDLRGRSRQMDPAPSDRPSRVDQVLEIMDELQRRGWGPPRPNPIE